MFNNNNKSKNLKTIKFTLKTLIGIYKEVQELGCNEKMLKLNFSPRQLLHFRARV